MVVVVNKNDTLPETNIFAPENGFLGWPIFRCELLVSGSVVIFQSKKF